MKYFITTLFIALSINAISQITIPPPIQDTIVNDTLIDGKIPTVVLIHPANSFPYKGVMHHRTVYILTFNQLKALSSAAAIDSTALSLIEQLEATDSLSQESIYELQEKNKILKQNYEIAKLIYNAEKEKGENIKSLLETKDALIKAQKKEVNRQKTNKWLAIIAGAAGMIMLQLTNSN